LLITGRGATATVRVATDIDLLVCSDAEFERSAADFPILYHNLGAILAERLARSSRHTVRDTLPHRPAFVREVPVGERKHG